MGALMLAFGVNGVRGVKSGGSGTRKARWFILAADVHFKERLGSLKLFSYINF